MKKLITDNIVENVRKLGLVKGVFTHMENAYVELIADIMKGLVAGITTPVAIHGCVNSGSGSNFNISAGAIWHNGEAFTIAAFVGTAGGGQVPRLTLVETKSQLAYTDNTNQDTLNTRTYAWAFGTSGSGLADFSTVASFASVVNNTLLDVDGQVATAVNALVAAAPGALDTLNELAAALGDDPNFATTVTNALATKSSKTKPAWTNLSLINGWDDDGVQPPRYRITDQNELELAGYIRSDSVSAGTFANLPNGTLPGSHDIQMIVANLTDSTFARIAIGGGSPTTLQIVNYGASKSYGIFLKIPLDAAS